MQNNYNVLIDPLRNSNDSSNSKIRFPLSHRLPPDLRRSVLAASLALLAGDACALLNDKVDLYVAETVTHDSNVFRISDAANANAAIGSSQKGDDITRTEFGVSLNVPVSRQRLVASLSANRTHYAHYSDLDFTGRAARGAWLWEAGDQLNGELGYGETKTLASFSDIQSRIVNPLLTQRAFASANYLITPRWQLQAGVTQTNRKNDNLAQRVNDSELRDLEFGLNYISPTTSKIGLSLRQTDGRLPNDQRVFGSLYSNDYRQHSVGLVTDWTISAKSRLTARLDHARRNYDDLSQRNWSGTLAQVNYDWKVSETFTLTARAQRDISPTEDIQTYFVLTKGVSLRPTLQLSPKTQISATLERSVRDYLGDAATVLGAPMRSDTVHTVGATLSYAPIPKLTLRFSVQREKRSSNIVLADYEDNLVYLSVNYAF